MQGRERTYNKSVFVPTAPTHDWSINGTVHILSIGLQPGNRERLLCAADGESHGESIREGGEYP